MPLVRPRRRRKRPERDMAGVPLINPFAVRPPVADAFSALPPNGLFPNGPVQSTRRGASVSDLAGALIQAAPGFVPGSGLADAGGYYPDMQGGYEPSLWQNLTSGNFGTAAMQGLGTVGDGLIAAGAIAPPLAAVGEAAKAPLAAARAMRNGAGKIVKDVPHQAVDGGGAFASRSANLYNPPAKPPRPFEADYSGGAIADEAGNLKVDIEGRPLTARYVVGRRVVGGADQALPPAEYDSVTKALTGRGPAVASLRGKAGAYEKRPLSQTEWAALSPWERAEHSGWDSFIALKRQLKPEDAPKVWAHEIGHAVNDRAGTDVVYGTSQYGRKIPFGEIPVTQVMQPELEAVYRDLNGGKQPSDFGYSGDDLRSEYMAEALRAYAADPNYFKAVAPKTAAAIRKAVYENPQVAKIIQFNSAAVAAGLGGMALAGSGGRAEAGER